MPAQHLDDLLEGEALRLEQRRRGRLAVTDNGRQDDRAIDAGALRLPRRGRGKVQHPQEILVWQGPIGSKPRQALGDPRDVARNLGPQAVHRQPRGHQHGRRLRIVGHGEQKMLERDGTMALLERQPMRTLQARPECC
jgi:hypothetical protein